ncbi:MAG: fumarylacetoacetate hydrolase family protein [Candidatus Lokiarchaeota archaeon]|nr:fumarylacetoacetate hydrolase family protein [Candidatus Lokiarchaeota archaeon]
MNENKIELPIAHNSSNYSVNPSKILCLGFNYPIQSTEGKRKVPKDPPKTPLLFPKTPNVLIGNDSKILYPKILHKIGLDQVDYEGELAVIMGKRGKNISKEHYKEFVLGYTCFNDVTARAFQLHLREKSWPWFMSKSLDTFGPIGPQLVLQEDIDDPNDLILTTLLNNREVQKTNTSEMFFKVDIIIEYISKYFTLYPGDIIATGTPSGVGSLSPGDFIEVKIENIGTLRNKVESE